MTLRTWLLTGTAVPLVRLSPASAARVLNAAAHELWPTLAPLIDGMLRKEGRRR